jgi:hypothetical protein
MDIIEKGFHVGLSIVNEYIYIYICYVLFNKSPTTCNENNPSSRIQLCYKDTYYVHRLSYYSKLYNIL